MATTRVIEVVIAAKDQFSRTMNTALSKVSKGFNAIKKVALLTAGAIAGVGAALLALTVTTANAGDEMQKMALRTGLTAQALSEFKFAAEISGTTIETFEKGMKTLAKRISDARFGLQSYVRIFEELNIEFQDAEGNLREVDDVFLDIVNSINQLSTETEKAALAQELLGKAGTQLLPLIKAGKDGIQELREEAVKLGITFSDIEAEQSAEFIDAMTRVKGALTGLTRALAIDLIPAFTQLLDGVTTFITEGRTIPAVINAITAAIRPLASAIGIDTRTELEKLNAEIEFMSSFESFQFFESGVTHAAELNRLLREQAILMQQARAEQERPVIDLGPPSGGSIFSLEELEAFDKLDIAFMEREEARAEASAGRRLAIEKNLEAQILGLKFATANQAAALLNVLGNKNKAFAIAALAFQKGLAIAQVLIQTEVAAAAALAPPPIGLGPLLGAALAAKIRLFGRLSAGFIAATGIAQAAGGGAPSGGGIGGGGGVGALPITSPVTAEPQATQVNITINTPTGDIAPDVIDRIIEGINLGPLRNITINGEAVARA